MSTTDYLKKHNLQRISVDIDKKVFLKLKKMANDEGKQITKLETVAEKFYEYITKHPNESKRKLARKLERWTMEAIG